MMRPHLHEWEMLIKPDEWFLVRGFVRHPYLVRPRPGCVWFITVWMIRNWEGEL